MPPCADAGLGDAAAKAAAATTPHVHVLKFAITPRRTSKKEHPCHLDDTGVPSCPQSSDAYCTRTEPVIPLCNVQWNVNVPAVLKVRVNVPEPWLLEAVSANVTL